MGWEPATDTEIALRDALRAGDQELYFRILGRSELLLPVAGDAASARGSAGWGTWTAENRTHVLAFTSSAALRSCLAEHAGPARRVPFQELASSWPNHEWWLAVDPGLPIEGYLPAWFVTQLVRGDVRIPGAPAVARGRLERLEALERAKAARTAPPPIQARGPQPPQPAYDPHLDEDLILDAEVIDVAEVRPVAAPQVHTPLALESPAAPPVPAAVPTAQPGGRFFPADPAFSAEPISPAAAAHTPSPPAAVPPPAPEPAPAARPGEGSLFEPVSTYPPAAVSPATEPAARPGEGSLFEPVSTYPPAAVPSATEPAAPTVPAGRPGEGSLFEPVSTYSTAAVQPAAEPVPAARPGEGSLFEPVTAAVTMPDVPVPPVREPGPRHERPGGPEDDFTPSNSVEEQLLEAADAGNTDAFLSTLLLATVLVPVPGGSSAPRPGEPGYTWQPRDIDGEPHIVCYTSTQTMPEPVEAVPVRFVKLIAAWPDPTWSFAVNPGTAVGASLPGDQLLELARWAAEMGLGGDEREPAVTAPTAGAAPPPGRRDPEITEMQKVIAASQIGYYLDRGYDRVSGFVHRAREVGHLRGPQALRSALGLTWTGSPFTADDKEIYVLRWPAYRPSLYRIPYGGQHEAAMKAMEGWVIERPPFRGNGFAPGDSTEIIAEFKVDSARLPHGARLLRVDADGKEEMVAVLDADGPRWLRTDGGEE
ncbi:SseB family protein [Catellatospora sichuanensis]|uniref:SseB family protein n=1 Tax=Catellatospora sichuanensis TaxID=1969805 RepID=UPI001FE70752|nr:SseB family protein [Catellatospora sichuanensis]